MPNFQYALAAHLPNIDELPLPSIRDGVDIGSSFDDFRVLEEHHQSESFGGYNLTQCGHIATEQSAYINAVKPLA